MTPEYNLCDKCGEQVPKEARAFMRIGSSMGPAGDWENDGFHVDLCASCWGQFVMYANKGKFFGLGPDKDHISPNSLGLAVKHWLGLGSGGDDA